MSERVTTPPGNRVTTPHRGRSTTSRRLPSAERTGNAPGRRDSSSQSRPAVDLKRAVIRWLGDGKAQGWSPRTIKDRDETMARFCWWLENEEKVPPTLDKLSPATIRTFLSYAREPRPSGRYGSERETAKREARPATVSAYFRCLRAFSNFCIAEGLLDETPLKNVKAPRVPTDQIQPLDPEQLQSLVDAARRTASPERDVSIILMLVDTGMRCSELTHLKMTDIDRGTGELTVVGKGNKKRTVYMGVTCRRALWRYLETDRVEALPDEALFVSVGGTRNGTGMTHTGVHRIIQRAGSAAGIKGVRCSPHTLRHTFAVNFLRGGGNLFELQQIMGHADLTVLRRYVALAEADLAQAHRNASPADRMRLR